MLAGLDSATPPTTAQVDAARQGGVRLWSGYLATRPAVNLLRPWSQAEFEVARGCGSTPIAFCSGLDDPQACRVQAGAWNVRLCLDVEGEIRPDGSWVQPWLDASGAGLYGNLPVHAGRTAAFHVLASRPAVDPQDVWPAADRPAGPLAWQWQGTHPEFGVGVDRGWYDADYFGGTSMTDDQLAAFWRMQFQLWYNRAPVLQSDGLYEDTYWMLHTRQVGMTQAVIDWVNAAAKAPDAVWAQLRALKTAPVGTHEHDFTGTTGGPK